MSETQYEVCVINTETGKQVKTIGVESAQRAGQIERGLGINLDHSRYHTEVAFLGRAGRE